MASGHTLPLACSHQTLPSLAQLCLDLTPDTFGQLEIKNYKLGIEKSS
jgi:hypothetical protein